MIQKNDLDNYNEEIFKKVSDVLGINNPDLIKNIIKIYYNCIIHTAVEEAFSADVQLKEFSFPLYEFGIITIERDKKTKYKIKDIELSNKFTRDIYDALIKGESKLTEIITKNLISSIKSAFLDTGNIGGIIDE